MSRYPEIYVLRHGETEWNRSGRFQGQLDSPLTELGHEHAADQAKILREAVENKDIHTFVSPSGRALATAAIALGDHFAPPKQDARLMEVNLGDWQGKHKDEIAQLAGDIADGSGLGFDRAFMGPGGENYSAFSTRIRAFLDELAGPAVIVTHGITSRVMRGLWLGLDYEDMREIGGGQGCVYHLIHGVQRKLTA